MNKVVDQYKFESIIGSGQFGKVYKALHLQKKEYFAVKAVKKHFFDENPKLKEFTVNEVHTLSKIDNPHVVKFIEMIKTLNNYYFVYELCEGGTLEDVIITDGSVPESEALSYLKQIIEGLDPVFRLNIMHRDLKPQNILFKNGKIKIADFGFCKQLQSRSDLAKTMLGSPIYMAPEILLGKEYGLKADIWSLGTMFYELLYGKCPFEAKSIKEIIDLISETNISFHENFRVSHYSIDLIKKMLMKDVKKRIEWEELYEEVLGKKYSQFPEKIVQIEKTEKIEKIQKFEKNNSLEKIEVSKNLDNEKNAYKIDLNDKFNEKNEFSFQKPNYSYDISEKYVLPEISSYTSPKKSLKEEYNYTTTISRESTPLSGQKLNKNRSQTSEYYKKTEFSPVNSYFNIKNNEKSVFGLKFVEKETESELFKFNIREELSTQDDFQRFVVKERLKLIFLLKVLNNYENLHIYEKKYEFLWIYLNKYVYLYGRKLKNGLIEKICYEISAKTPNITIFIMTKEFESYCNSLKKDIESISFHYLNQKDEFLNIVGIDNVEKEEILNDNSLNFQLFVKKAKTYIDNIKNDFRDNLNKKILLHCIEIIDCILLDELSDKYIDEKYSLFNQKYFNDLDNCENIGLQLILTQKTELFRKKYDFL